MLKKIPEGSECSCGFKANKGNSLPAETILNGRFIVGKQISENQTAMKYLCYDAKISETVMIKEFYTRFFVSRKSGLNEVVVDTEYEEAYRVAVFEFVKKMQIAQTLNDSDFFINIKQAFFENNTVYSVMKNHSHITLSECVEEGRTFSEKTVVQTLRSEVEDLCKLDKAHFLNGNISADNVYVSDNYITVDGFEPTIDDFSSFIKDAVVFDRTSFYMSVSDFSRKGKDIFSDVFSVGAILYTMLTGEFPKSPFENDSQFNIAILEKSVNNKKS